MPPCNYLVYNMESHIEVMNLYLHIYDGLRSLHKAQLKLIYLHIHIVCIIGLSNDIILR